MSSALFAPVCAIAPTRRRRFLWAAWWTARALTPALPHSPTRLPAERAPALKPHAAAERAANCKLSEIESSWARAWSNILIGKEPWPSTQGRQ
ncbi:MAG: hypothetical protein WDO74_28205 [Pseudomonadota bacterium]